MSKQVRDYFWTKIKENDHSNDSKFSSSHSEKIFSYTWLLSNSLDQSGHQQHHTTRLIEFLLDTGFGLPLNVWHCMWLRYYGELKKLKSKWYNLIPKLRYGLLTDILNMMISFKGRNSDHVDCTLNSDSPVCCSKKTKKERVNVGSPQRWIILLIKLIILV
jgi:hypothetical protein